LTRKEYAPARDANLTRFEVAKGWTRRLNRPARRREKEVEGGGDTTSKNCGDEENGEGQNLGCLNRGRENQQEVRAVNGRVGAREAITSGRRSHVHRAGARMNRSS